MSVLTNKHKLDLITNIIRVYHTQSEELDHQEQLSATNEVLTILTYIKGIVNISKEDLLSEIKLATIEHPETIADTMSTLWALYRIM